MDKPASNGSVVTHAQRIDWDAVRKRIAQVGQILSGEDEIDETTMQRVWERRAEQLAQVHEIEDDAESIELVLMCVVNKVFGLPVRHVNDIRPLGCITSVPRTPDWLAGVTHWRGRILTVIDVRHYFDLLDGDASHVSSSTCLIVVESPSMQIGLLVDDVLSINRLGITQKQLPDAAAHVPDRYISGVAQSDDLEYPSVAILDLQCMLADPRLVVRMDDA